MDKTSLGDRMKQYEAVPKNFLLRRTPVIIRLDGKAFHTFTRGFDKPFDEAIEIAMETTMLRLCQNIQGCVLGYTQSDEITLVLCDYQKVDTDAWFEYNVEKMCSVAASMATLYFFKALYGYRNELKEINDINFADKIDLIDRKLEMGAFFDARCFNVPKEEVVNCLIWRQQDATRNSIQALAQSLYSQKQLSGLKCSQLQDKMFTEKGVNWNNLSTYQKRGACAVKKLMPRTKKTKNSELIGLIYRPQWIIDLNIPVFTQNREYINSILTFDKEQKNDD